jgi:SAM-dependent methyltransferase
MFIVHTLIYPHYLMNFKMKKGERKMMNYLFGKVLEVGAGNGVNKELALKTNPKITNYQATDCKTFLKEINHEGDICVRFPKDNNKDTKESNKLKIYWLNLKNSFLNYNEWHLLDNDCDACDLSYNSSEFDCHISYETLEHIKSPLAYFDEANRVIKKGGIIAVSVPYLYRLHGGEPRHSGDYYRYSLGFFYEIAKKYNLKIIELFCNTGFGTTFAEMANQWLILRIKDSVSILGFILLLISPFYFAINNLIGYVIDLKPDIRFSTRWHIIFQKNNS